MFHHSLIEHVKSESLIVQSKEIKVVVPNQTNAKAKIKEAKKKINEVG